MHGKHEGIVERTARSTASISAAVVPRKPDGELASVRTAALVVFGAVLSSAVRRARQVVAWKTFERKNAKEGKSSRAIVLYSDRSESVEWVNMCVRKVWRVYQRNLEAWFANMLQLVLDNVLKKIEKPLLIRRVEVSEFYLDHEPPLFRNMSRRTSRKDSDLNGVFDLRYTGGAHMLLTVDIGRGKGRVGNLRIPIKVYDLDVDAKIWLKIRLAPITPYIGSLSFAFAGRPNIRIQLAPYNRVQLMRIPILQDFLRQLITVSVPSMMVLPKRLEVNIPPAVTAIAEAAIGREAVMQALAMALLGSSKPEVVSSDLIEELLMEQRDAGGMSLPEKFKGELIVVLKQARGLAIRGWSVFSNPYCKLMVGTQVCESKRNRDTGGGKSWRGHPVWNQEFQFLVRDPGQQELEVHVYDSRWSLRKKYGVCHLPMSQLQEGRPMRVWLPLSPDVSPEGQATDGDTMLPLLRRREGGEVQLEVTYKEFVDDEYDSGYREAEAMIAAKTESITDAATAAAATTRAAEVTAAAVNALAVTKAAALKRVAQAATALRGGEGGDKVSEMEDEDEYKDEQVDASTVVEEINELLEKAAAYEGSPHITTVHEDSIDEVDRAGTGGVSGSVSSLSPDAGTTSPLIAPKDAQSKGTSSASSKDSYTPEVEILPEVQRSGYRSNDLSKYLWDVSSINEPPTSERKLLQLLIVLVSASVVLLLILAAEIAAGGTPIL